MLSCLVSDRFGCIFPILPGLSLWGRFLKEAAWTQGLMGICCLPPKHRTWNWLPNPLHCPQPLTSTNAPRSIPSIQLYQDDFTHRGCQAAQRPSTSRGLTSSSQLAPSTWTLQLTVGLDLNIKPSQGGKLNPRHGMFNLLAVLILFVNTRERDAQLRCLAKPLSFPTGSP